MVTGPAARAAFDLRKESPHLRDRYGRHHLGPERPDRKRGLSRRASGSSR